jgi:hypothetical protein
MESLVDQAAVLKRVKDKRERQCRLAVREEKNVKAQPSTSPTSALATATRPGSNSTPNLHRRQQKQCRENLSVAKQRIRMHQRQYDKLSLLFLSRLLPNAMSFLVSWSSLPKGRGTLLSESLLLPALAVPSIVKTKSHSSDDVPVDWISRRGWGCEMIGILSGFPSIVQAADMPIGMQAESISLQSGLLDSRVTENVLSPPPYGLELPDICYPLWFSGTWKVESVGTDVQAPCGVTLFGGNTTYQTALSEVGTTLRYESRFINAGQDVIADREYNVKSIAKAAMGPNSVVDIPLATPNKFSAILAPVGSPSLLKVDLITLLRRQENVDATHFDCSEVVREIVAPVGQSGPVVNTATILKEVETTSLYTYDPQQDKIHCRQRSAVFLLPSQQNPMAMKMFEYSRGRPIDVRFYDVMYSR